MKIKSEFYVGIDLTLKECSPSDLIPAYEIVSKPVEENYTESKTVIYRYAGQLWFPIDGMTVKQFVRKVEKGLYSRPECIDRLQEYIAAGNCLYHPAVEPFYWLNSGYLTVNAIVDVSYRNKEFLRSHRRFAHNEREKAVEGAKEIIRIVCGDGHDEADCFPERIIRVLPGATLIGG